MILVCWEEEKKKWNLKVRGTGHSWVKELFTDYIGAKRGKSTMESLQQATDGDGQRRNARRYRESNVTLRRYIEDERGQETSWWEALLVIKARSAAAVHAAQPETNGGPKGPTPYAKTTVCICTAKSSACGPVRQKTTCCAAHLSLFPFFTHSDWVWCCFSFLFFLIHSSDY